MVGISGETTTLLHTHTQMSSLTEVGFSENIDRDCLFFINAPEEAWCEVERRSQDWKSLALSFLNSATIAAAAIDMLASGRMAADKGDVMDTSTVECLPLSSSSTSMSAG